MFRRFPILRSATSYNLIVKQVSDRFFDAQRQETLQNLNENKNDKSLAGKVDPRILDVVNLINSKHDYFTTSSCSGRISLFHRESPGFNCAEQQQQQQTQGSSSSSSSAMEINKKRGSGLGTLYQTHDPLPLDCDEALEQCWNAFQLGDNHRTSSVSCPRGTVELKFEPLILHVRCRDLQSSQKLLDAAAASGLRKTGLIAPSVRLPMKSEERDLLKVLKLAPNHDEKENGDNYNQGDDSSSSSVIPNYVLGHNFLVSIGSMAGVNNIVCLQGEMMIEKEKFHTLLKYFNENLLMGENEKRKKMLFENISKF